MRAEVWGKWSQKEPLATSTRDCSMAMYGKKREHRGKASW